MNSIKKHQIFIIDDSHIQLILLEKVLRKEGFSVKSFSNGYNMLESLKNNLPNLIISDIDMPVINGFELIEEVKSEVGRTQIPFFLISSNGEMAIQKRARETGADMFLQKPFKYQVLIDVVKEMLGMVEA